MHRICIRLLVWSLVAGLSGSALGWAQTVEQSSDLAAWSRSSTTAASGAPLTPKYSLQIQPGTTSNPIDIAGSSSEPLARFFVSPDRQTIWRWLGGSVNKAQSLRPAGPTVDLNPLCTAPHPNMAALNDGTLVISCPSASKTIAVTPDGITQTYLVSAPLGYTSDSQGLATFELWTDGNYNYYGSLRNYTLNGSALTAGSPRWSYLLYRANAACWPSAVTYSREFARVDPLVWDGVRCAVGATVYLDRSTGASQGNPGIRLPSGTDSRGLIWSMGTTNEIVIWSYQNGAVTRLRSLYFPIATPTDWSFVPVGNDKMWVVCPQGVYLYTYSGSTELLAANYTFAASSPMAPAVANPDSTTGGILLGDMRSSYTDTTRSVQQMELGRQYVASSGPITSPDTRGSTATPVFSGIAVTASEPQGTQLRWAVSFTGGTTWERYRDGQWQTLTDRAAIATEGMTTAELQALSMETIGPRATQPLQVAAVLQASADLKSAPSVSAVTFRYSPYPNPVANNLTCPDALRLGQTVSCQVMAATPGNIGTLTYTWAADPSTTTLTPSQNAAAITPRAEGTVTVTVTVRLLEDETKMTTRVATLQVNPPIVTGNLTCPGVAGRRQFITCQAAVESSAPNTVVRWTTDDVDSVVEPNAERTQARIRWSSLGTKTVSVNISSPDFPTLGNTATASVQVVGWQKPLLRLRGPQRVVRGTPVSVQAVVTEPKHPEVSGTVTVEWTVNGQTLTGPVLDLETTRAGSVAIQAKARYAEANGDPDAESDPASLTITVTPQRPPNLRVKVPRLAVKGLPMTLEASATGANMIIEWSLPDQPPIRQATVTVTPTVANRTLVMTVRAIPGEGSLPEEIASKTLTFPVLDYTFPAFTLEKRGEKDASAPYEVMWTVKGELKSAPGGQFTYQWDFGDGEQLETTRPKVVKVYATPGAYPMRVTVRDQIGHAQTLTDTVTVSEVQPYRFDLKFALSNRFWKAPLRLRVRPTVTGGIKREKITGYQWWVDGQPVSQERMGDFTIAEPGEHQLKLQIATEHEHTAEHTVTITTYANQAPVCALQQRTALQPRQVRLQAICRDQDGRVANYAWDFGDGRATDGKPFVTIEYEQPGTYTVTMTATDDDGATTSATQTVAVQ